MTPETYLAPGYERLFRNLQDPKDETREKLDDAHVFSGSDIVAYANLPGKISVRLGTLAVLSVSSHRDKFPVTSLGRTEAKAFTAGHRTVGGTLIFATTDRLAWQSVLTASRARSTNPDELPPFDISVTFVNEHASVSYAEVRGVVIVDEGVSYSVDSPQLLETYSFMAAERIPLQPFSSWDKANRWDGAPKFIDRFQGSDFLNPEPQAQTGCDGNPAPLSCCSGKPLLKDEIGWYCTDGKRKIRVNPPPGYRPGVS